MSFFSESIKEFDHVVWPTKVETIKYFNVVVAMIVVLALVLFIVGTALFEGLYAIKGQISPITPKTTSSSVSDIKLDPKDIKVETAPTTTK